MRPQERTCFIRGRAKQKKAEEESIMSESPSQQICDPNREKVKSNQ